MNYKTQKDKQQRVEQLIANIPVGTKFQEFYIGLHDKYIMNQGVVVGHTKSGNIKLETVHGRKMKTVYHFQKLDKSADFDVAGKPCHWVEFI